jgi:hypothetical protein
MRYAHDMCPRTRTSKANSNYYVRLLSQSPENISNKSHECREKTRTRGKDMPPDELRVRGEEHEYKTHFLTTFLLKQILNGRLPALCLCPVI